MIGLLNNLFANGWQKKPPKPKPQFLDDVNMRRKLGEPRTVELLSDFRFRDSSGKIWTAQAGKIVDGSSIPRLLWPIVGSPFVGCHFFASVIHDVGCKDRWADSSTVHRLYYEGNIAAGVPMWKARIRWLAVRIFGPRWS